MRRRRRRMRRGGRRRADAIFVPLALARLGCLPSETSSLLFWGQCDDDAGLEDRGRHEEEEEEEEEETLCQ
jgi:hypothetical protein